MKKALVFVAAFALVLTAGVALALVAGPEPQEGGASQQMTTTTEAPDNAEADSPDSEAKGAEAQEEKPEETSKEKEVSEEKGEAESETEETKPTTAERDTTPPDLVISHPEDGQHFTESKVVFEGKTEPGARVYAGKYEADVDGEGHWRIVLILSSGGNTATLRALDPAGNESFAKVQVFYDPPTVDEKPEKDEHEEGQPTEEPQSHEFVAHQKYGSCAEDVPYDVWYGTGTPGTKVFIGSEFGTNSTTIGEMGKWDLKVKFPEAPCGETFRVVLETDRGDREVFEFTRICDEAKGSEESPDGHDD
ncbi:MAG: hypothetical protein PVF87_09175 [Acidimicrobiia bacterium]|jgi:hypothetical protein